MPEKHEFLPMSLVTFTRARQEEIFLLYSTGFENGPGIHRDGQGSPWMIDPESQNRKVTDPHEQRKGTWLVNEDARKLVRESVDAWVRDVVDKRNQGLMDPRDAEQRIRYYQAFVGALSELSDYEDAFHRAYPGSRIVGMQGCGNLSMNEWYVAYLRSPFTGGEPRFVALPEDRLDRVPARQYTCLVKYRGGRTTIEPLFFNFLKRCVCRRPDRQDITDEIEFAVYGTQVLRNGELVDFSNIVEQIADVRHLFRLPNLNPKQNTESEPHTRPRRFFGEKQYDDVWFGEAELLKNLALRRAALTEPVLLNRQFEHMGADPDYISEMFGKSGYREDHAGDRFLRYSDASWRFRQETDELVEVKLLRNVYAYSLIGLDEGGNILALAVGGLAGRRGQTLEAAVQNIRSYGAVDALLIDQGDDVFQYAVSPRGTYEPRVRLLRPQLRAVFVFATPAEEAEGASNGG
jgi:hypothetical protein